MRLTVNGTEHEVVAPPLSTLLQVLREELFVTSPKAGCQQGGCGACTVLVDGEPRRSCLVAVGAVEGAQVTTVEGLGAPDELSGVQAGFMMAAQALVERGDGNVEREEVIEALNGHLCRCTGYVKIVDAATAAVRGDTSPAHASADTDPQGDDAVTLLPGSPA
jgi:aerobic-type carbon monoxide dehydrogenase small subunit (CoxS/CutS family)